MKKNFIYFAALSVAAIFNFASCVKEYDPVAENTSAVKVTMSPSVEELDWNTKEFSAAIVITKGSEILDLDWTATIVNNPSWVKAEVADYIDTFTETFTKEEIQVAQKGIKLSLTENTEYKRAFSLVIEVEDGTKATYNITHIGTKADAAVSSKTESIDFGFIGGKRTLVYETNMGDVYDYEIKYGPEDKDWLKINDEGAGKVSLTTERWNNENNGRTAEIIVKVGTEQTSFASLTIPVRQAALGDIYYYLYGESARKLSIEKSIEMTKVDINNFHATTAFLPSADGKNPILVCVDGRALNYPYYAIAGDGKIVMIEDESTALPQGPEIKATGLRKLYLNFEAMTWTWTEISAKNACPESELVNYPTKDYVAEDGTVKTWMTVSLHWNGGPAIGSLKLGSGLVAGDKTGGYGNTGSDQLVDRITDYDTEENGGKVVEVLDANGQPLANTKGRLYSGYEAITGEPTGCLTYMDLHPFLEEEWVDAIGNTIPVGNVRVSNLSGKTAKEVEETYPMVAAQMQGICPYGWHIANLQDWVDLAYSVAVMSQGGDYAADPTKMNYDGLGSNSGALKNIAANLYDKDFVTYYSKVNRSNKADEVNFNMFCQGWRLRRTGYDYGPGDSQPRFYAMIPMRGNYSDTKMAAWRVYTNGQGVADLTINDGFDFGNGCGAAIRCVKNYVK